MPDIYTTDDLLEPDSDSRADAAIACAGATGDIDAYIPNYGDFNGDHTENQHAVSFEHTDVDSTDREYIAYPKDE